jgi:predicted lipase
MPLWNDTTTILVHHGFLETYNSLKIGIVEYIMELIQVCPTCDFLFTGHSLGGAMATIAVVDLHRMFGIEAITSFTFGSPRVGNTGTFLTNSFAYVPTDFALLYKKVVSTNYRVVNKRDIVPRVPSHVFEVSGYEFWHVSEEVWYPTDPITYKLCDESGEDPSCSISINFLWCSVADHGTYLGYNTTDGHMHGC